jgi:anthranilate phosphoribosyltransferase
MTYSHYLRRMLLGAGAGDLSQEDAYALLAAMLDDGVPDLELGALLLALRLKNESLDELVGFDAALAARVYALYPPRGALQPLVLPTYHGARRHPNLTPLLAILLSRFGVPVLLHGTLESAGRTTTAAILRELGVLPCARIEQAQAALAVQRLAFVPTAVLCPGLGTLLIQRARLGVRNIAHRLLPLLDPFFGESVRLVATCHPLHRVNLRRFLQLTNGRALLLQGVQGEPHLRLHQRAEIEFIDRGARRIFVGPLPSAAESPPVPVDIAGTAEWMREILEGRQPVPQSLAVQVACCLFASGYTADIGQALAIVAGELGLPRPVARMQEVA